MNKIAFTPTGLLAIDPRAFGTLYDAPGANVVTPAQSSGPAVVTVRGPLMNHRDWCFESYEALREKVANACASEAPCVLLDIDSPGGLVAGCFETAQAIREMCERAGKPLYAYAQNATSAAYALACAASYIFTPSTGRTGSIGVIETYADTTAADAAMGVRFAVITSGARKADGNPHVPLTDDRIAAAQASVDTAAALFYEYVATARGIDSAAVKGLDAAIFLGAQATELRLADAVLALDQVLAQISDPAYVPGKTMAKASKAIQALHEEAESDDEKTRANARKMLAKYYAEEDGGDESEDKDGDKKDAKAESDEKKDDEKKDDKDSEAKAAAASVPAVATSAAPAPAAVADDSGKRALALAERTEKARLLATRPDFSSEMVEAFMASPLADVERFVKTIPKGKVPATSTVKDALAAAAPTETTRGDANAGASAPREGYSKEELDIQMGLKAPEPVIAQFDHTGKQYMISALTPEQARARLAALKKGDSK